MRTALEKDEVDIEDAEVRMVPKQTLDLDARQAVQALKLIENLEELEDVRTVSTNVNFSDEALNAYAEATK